MTARLGETCDPKALIPGDPFQLYGSVGQLTDRADAVEAIGDDLHSVRTPGWNGDAGDAFWDDFSPQKSKWYRGADSLRKASSALQDYAGVLKWGQEQAAEAVALYDAGDESGAEDKLESARSQVESAGDTAKKRFEKVGGSDSDSPAWLYWASQDAQSPLGQSALSFWEPKPFEHNPWLLPGQVTPPEGGEEEKGKYYRGWGNNQDQEVTEDRRDKALGLSVGLASASGDAKVWGAEASGYGSALGGDVSGRASFDTLGVEGGAGLGVEDGRAQAQASGKAYLAQGSAEGKYEAGVFETSGKVAGFAGAEANAAVSAGKDGVHAGAEAFAGGKATAEGHASVAGVGVGGTAEAWLGIGAEAHADAGMENGKLVIGADVGAAIGFGGQLGGQVEIDPGQVADTLGDAGSAAKDWTSDKADALGSVFG
ncbi:putative T7SS-secreted protein [Streptomyces sp. NPDC102360]|uniref:putative T7SS-secreted protein n=1 Tax=Streptomyces sp. NPDC102360 TaxID=3366160 RepID=UPI003809F758